MYRKTCFGWCFNSHITSWLAVSGLSNIPMLQFSTISVSPYREISSGFGIFQILIKPSFPAVYIILESSGETAKENKGPVWPLKTK